MLSRQDSFAIILFIHYESQGMDDFEAATLSQVGSAILVDVLDNPEHCLEVSKEVKRRSADLKDTKQT